MNVVILSCNTGEGHNAAGKAIMEELKRQNISVEMLDYMKLSSDKTSKLVGGIYINIAKHAPKLFHLLYRAGMVISSNKYKSPIYYANALMTNHLREYFEQHQTDIIVMPHLFPAETITYMKNQHEHIPKTIAVATDYTCIPFWEETDCDCYVIPDESLMQEYTDRGVPREKLYPLGIPVSAQFIKKPQEEAYKKRVKDKLGISEHTPMYLIMGGSMGFGKIPLFTYKLYKALKNGEHIVVICGNNKKLHAQLKVMFFLSKRVHIVGYTNHAANYMHAADVIYSKPGGLSSTEISVLNRPLIHTAPIPGCETCNLNYFTERDMSVAATDLKKQIELGKTLVSDKVKQDSMCEAQRKYSKPNASKNIVSLMKKLVNS